MSILNDKRRLVLEVETMKERYPDARLRIDGTKVWYEVDLRVEGGTYPLQFIYPERYPFTHPRSLPQFEMPKYTPHMNPDGSICWIYPSETKRNRNRWNPGTDTMAVAVGAALRWLVAYLVWRASGRWPVKDALDE